MEQCIQGRLEQEIDRRFRRFEERFGEIVDRLDALGVDVNQNRNNGRRPRVNMARGDPANQPIPVRRPTYSDHSSSSEEFDELEEGRRFDGRRGQGGNRRRNDDVEGYDFKLKVDIPSFNGGMGIEEFLDWLADVDRFFDYMETPEDKRVRLVACRLKGGASAWWDRKQRAREREGRGRVRSWYRMRRMLMQEFLSPDYEQILF